ncbi:catechol 2,3-dioxygenase [Cereibacter ovatus]|uniref:Catechol 2,3-dioxygenase n=2 Tax=Cereibacter ovatus TaxID=439529 RepID=A0A285CIL9_9RHOB|nr:catechol 2,3-dioxygenase [Cereibacter ovatus]
MIAPGEFRRNPHPLAQLSAMDATAAGGRQTAPCRSDTVRALTYPAGGHPISFAEPLKEIAMTMLPPETRIGHVHLKVADLDRAIAFYAGVLGFEVQQKFGTQAAFLSAGGYHHHIGLNTWDSLGGRPPAPGTTGLYHTAILFPDRASLAAAVQRVIRAGLSLEGAADHGVSEAVYLRDPDGNGVELYRDRAPADWPRDAAGALAMGTQRLDLAALLAEAP